MIRLLSLAAVLICSVPGALNAGGWFVLTLGQPGAHSDPLARSSAFVVRVYGCAADAAAVEATAEGLVNGRRVAIPLQPIRLAGGRDTIRYAQDSRTVQEWPSFSFAVPRTWPADGHWVIKVAASAGMASQTALVVPTAEGFDRSRSRLHKAVFPADIDAALSALTREASATLRVSGR